MSVSKIQNVKVKIKGVSPYLMNPMTEDILDELRTGNRAPIMKDRPVEEISQRKLCTESGKIGIPVENLLACMAEAGRKVKHGKDQISTAKTTTMYSLLSVEETFLPFTNLVPENDGWIVDKRRGRLKDGTAVCIVRPKFMSWGFEFTLTIDGNGVSPDTIKQLVKCAGNIGLGDFRPSCKGPFGRFTIESWEIMENVVKEAA
ncbi:MAG: hypothetical protein KBC48_00120 [Candidatus Pacebacteria bacterium]|nr:hypothetical protein [Candidatus Paceibacterota bacterium]